MAQTKLDIIHGLFDSYKTKDRERLDLLLADDFTFTSPYDDRIDKAMYFERCWPPGIEYIAAHTLERIVIEDDHAFVLYKAVTKDGKEFRNIELFTFDRSKIKSVEVYFGAAYKNGQFVRA